MFRQRRIPSFMQKQDPPAFIEQVNISPKGFRIYWKRWLMLFLISSLNLLSDWTCYSVAPIAVLTDEAFGTIYPTVLVVIFFVANSLSTICEPILLSRLGLRRTIVLGSTLLFLGSLIKSSFPGFLNGGMYGDDFVLRIYIGFFLVGKSNI